jgi:probable F420-dependent oxidoreductase
MDIGKLGVWFFLDALAGPDSAAFARKVESLGYSALWIPEAAGREPFAHGGYLLANTKTLILATGIANVWARDALAMAAASRTLAELSGGRFVLGMGVSHAPLVEKLRGGQYAKPYSYMKEYVAKMKTAFAQPFMYQAVKPKEDPPIVLAALHPKMLAFAAAEVRGTHTYFVPPEHTAKVRAAIGPEPWICAAQAVILEADAAVARKAARAYMKTYVPRLPNYTNNLKALGWKDEEFKDGCSDKLVDAIVAWGDAAKIRERIAAHHTAGATHVCILPLRSDGAPVPDERVLEALAPR